MTTLTQGIVLRHQDYGDYDRQFLIYTRDMGKISVIAKGAKKITSKLNSHMEPFLISQIMVANGKVFKRLAAAQTLSSFRNIPKDLEKIVIAQYFLESLDLFLGYEFCD